MVINMALMESNKLEQFSIRANGSADIKDHAIQFGFEYEKELIEVGLLSKLICGV